MLKQTAVKRIDTNHKPAGSCQASFEVDENGEPTAVYYDHSTEGLAYYWRTGKIGTSRDTNEVTYEMATASDERCWVNAEMTTVWED